MNRSVPVFDLETIADPGVISRLFKALKDVGFIYIANHGISRSLIAQQFQLSQHFFNQSSEIINAFAYDPTTNQGWIRPATEALNRQNTLPELKEAFNVSPNSIDVYSKNTSVFNSEGVLLFSKECHRVCNSLLRAYAACLSIPYDFFESHHQNENPNGTTLRYLYYPAPLTPSSCTRAGGHSDFGSLTLLFRQESDPGGLEVLLNGLFVRVPHIQEHILVNTGDLMEYWTGGILKSTIHRVVMPIDPMERYSIAYFCHADNDAPLDTVQSLLNEVDVKERYESIEYENLAVAKVGRVCKNAGEHLERRLQRIHL